jgi:hypothetical protein
MLGSTWNRTPPIITGMKRIAFGAKLKQRSMRKYGSNCSKSRASTISSRTTLSGGTAEFQTDASGWPALGYFTSSQYRSAPIRRCTKRKRAFKENTTHAMARSLQTGFVRADKCWGWHNIGEVALIFRKSYWLGMLGSIAIALSTTAALAECQEYKKGSAAYKRCLSYLSMAGTPRQREDAADQARQDRARRNCAWYPSATSKNRIWACDDYKTRREREREEAQKRANRGEDDKPLTPIINPDSGAFGPPKPPPKTEAARCPPNHVLSRNRACVATVQCRPGYAVSPVTGRCVPGCRPGFVLSRNGGCMRA